MAHENDACRTVDVRIDENVEFSSLMLSSRVLNGLQKNGFKRPSPVQLKAIPFGKCGVDLIVQAKSGTGKTCVFAVVALEMVSITGGIQAVILAPTREIAVQIKEVVEMIGCCMPGLKCHACIGGMSIEQDIQKLANCHIVVGTPGRVKDMIENKKLKTESIRLFVLDEADKLLESGSFQEQMNWIYSTLPKNKQVLALSATYPKTLASHLSNYMNDPLHVRINSDIHTLLGIEQFYDVVPGHHLPHVVFERKADKLLSFLSRISFQQCLVFSNYQTRAEHLAEKLSRKGWPVTFVAGKQPQEVRLNAMKKLKDFQCRILISTDLMSRGIDCDKVDLVINLDLPWDADTYLHRVGRAGRFGNYGVALSFVTPGAEMQKLEGIAEEIKHEIKRLAAGWSGEDFTCLKQQDHFNEISDKNDCLENGDDCTNDTSSNANAKHMNEAVDDGTVQSVGHFSEQMSNTGNWGAILASQGGVSMRVKDGDSCCQNGNNDKDTIVQSCEQLAVPINDGYCINTGTSSVEDKSINSHSMGESTLSIDDRDGPYQNNKLRQSHKTFDALDNEFHSESHALQDNTGVNTTPTEASCKFPSVKECSVRVNGGDIPCEYKESNNGTSFIQDNMFVSNDHYDDKEVNDLPTVEEFEFLLDNFVSTELSSPSLGGSEVSNSPIEGIQELPGNQSNMTKPDKASCSPGVRYSYLHNSASISKGNSRFERDPSDVEISQVGLSDVNSKGIQQHVASKQLVSNQHSDLTVKGKTVLSRDHSHTKIDGEVKSDWKIDSEAKRAIKLKRLETDRVASSTEYVQGSAGKDEGKDHLSCETDADARDLHDIECIPKAVTDEIEPTEVKTRIEVASFRSDDDIVNEDRRIESNIDSLAILRNLGSFINWDLIKSTAKQMDDYYICGIDYSKDKDKVDAEVLCDKQVKGLLVAGDSVVVEGALIDGNLMTDEGVSSLIVDEDCVKLEEELVVGQLDDGNLISDEQVSGLIVDKGHTKKKIPIIVSMGELVENLPTNNCVEVPHKAGISTTSIETILDIKHDAELQNVEDNTDGINEGGSFETKFPLRSHRMQNHYKVRRDVELFDDETHLTKNLNLASQSETMVRSRPVQRRIVQRNREAKTGLTYESSKQRGRSLKELNTEAHNERKLNRQNCRVKGSSESLASSHTKAERKSKNPLRDAPMRNNPRQCHRHSCRQSQDYVGNHTKFMQALYRAYEEQSNWLGHYSNLKHYSYPHRRGHYYW